MFIVITCYGINKNDSVFPCVQTEADSVAFSTQSYSDATPTFEFIELNNAHTQRRYRSVNQAANFDAFTDPNFIQPTFKAIQKDIQENIIRFPAKLR